MKRGLRRAAALGAAAVAPAAAASPGEELLDLLTGEFNNHEQVWQQKLDGTAHVERRHWRFERTGGNRLLLSAAPGQAAGAAAWAFDLRPESLDTAVAPVDGGGPSCSYHWQAQADGFTGRATPSGSCPESLPGEWRVSATHLFASNGPSNDATRYAARRVRHYRGWIALHRHRIDPSAPEDDVILMRKVRLHDEGSVFPIADAGEPTGYAVELARLTYQNTGIAVLKLGIVDQADGETLSYAWTAPLSDRVGINLRWVQAGFTRED